jgi:hypothetical protein
MLSQSPLMSDAVDISPQSITLTADILTDPVLSGGRSITTPAIYDGILFTNGALLSTGETLANNSFINANKLIGDGILMGQGELIAVMLQRSGAQAINPTFPQ